jgi:hypothetical protein
MLPKRFPEYFVKDDAIFPEAALGVSCYMNRRPELTIRPAAQPSARCMSSSQKNFRGTGGDSCGLFPQTPSGLATDRQTHTFHPVQRQL